MKNDPQVSLILCGYNAAATMASALESASAQTLEQLEILCVNDGSTDATSEIFLSYAEKDPRIEVIDHPVNKGLLAARQTGVEHASGKYVMFLDLDDALRPEACEELARMMDESGCDLIQFEAEMVYPSEEERLAREKIDSGFFAAKREKTLCGSDDIVGSCFLEREFPWNVWSKIWKTELARRVYSHVPQDMKVVMAEDAFAFFLAASMAEKLAFSKKKYYLYSIGTGVSGNTDLRKSETSLKVYSALIEPYAAGHPSEAVRRASEALGRFFRSCVGYKLRSVDTIESCRTIAEREIRDLGETQAALTFVENWDMIGMHPMKPAFLGCCAGIPSRPAAKIRKLGVICTGMEIAPSLRELVGTLREEGFETRLYVRNGFRANGKDAADRRIDVLPEKYEELDAFLRSAAFRKENDGCILSFGPNSDRDLTAFLLFDLRFVLSRIVFAFREREMERLNCHDRIFMSASDCVLSGSADSAPLFGELGVSAGHGEKGRRLREIVSAFEPDGPGEAAAALRAARERMRTTALEALAALGYAGFGRTDGLTREFLEKMLAAAGRPCSVDEYYLMRVSGFFDDEYYRGQFPGCAIEDTILHFCKVGSFQLAAPSAVFDLKQYCAANPDLYPVRMNLVVHYLCRGIGEGRKFTFPFADRIRNSGYFDEARYRAEHGDELGTWDPLYHYLLIGWKKGYLPSELFVDRYYADCYLGFEGDTLNPLYYYVRWGKSEGRCPFPLRPRFEEHFPEGYDTEAFWLRKGKYLIVVHQLDLTGVPILAKMVAEIFAGEQCAGIISPMDGPLRDACLKAGIPVLIDSDFYVHRARAAFYREKGFGVCLFNTLGLIKPFLRTAAVIPSVLWVHDNIPRSFLSEGIQRRIAYAPTVFATSRTTLEMVREYNPAVRYLPYPVRDMCGRHKTAVPERIRFGVFGVYCDRKGQDLAIEAFRKLPAGAKSKAELWLIGNATAPEFAEKIGAMAAGEEHIRFVPAQKDSDAYHRLYESLEVQICPSRTDPMPLVVFDGMMHGCPEILSDTVGQSEFIRNGENGYVFPAEDVTALRDCMARIIENAERFPELSRASRRTFLDNFEFDRAAQVIRGVLDEVKRYL